ncbi:hypothetical protein [Arthrobacter sp. ok362]|uniref:hypothetical protein n=1 Tax=Arthrobacter sp. ok362 TaxID=1761745 RepID=UPI00088989AC|nr:hypothetical protein [Arthrobacter sp. ok362]SDL77821.1 hypothetical protein SAMN04487913_11495 [Arthrobacter sp. ok362]
MTGFGSVFSREPGIKKFYRRVIEDASAAGSYDLLKDERYSAVVDELIEGRDIKAIEVYCDVTGGNIAEGKAAVDEFRYLLSEK